MYSNSCGYVASPDFSIDEIDNLLFSILGSHEQVRKWWMSPNKHFYMKTPALVYETDQDGPKQVYQYVTSFCFR